MWPFDKRRKEFEECLNDLRSRLEGQGIRIDYYFEKSSILDHLVLPIYTGFHDHEYDFMRFVRKFRRKRNRPNFDLETIATKGETPRGFVSVGTKNNPNYQEESTHYNMIEHQIRMERKMADEEIRKIMSTDNYKTFEYVQREDEKTECYSCSGYGDQIVGESGVGGSLGPCSSCGGSGKNDYEPNVTPNQRKIASDIKERLERLKGPTLTELKEAHPVPNPDICIYARLK